MHLCQQWCIMIHCLYYCFFHCSSILDYYVQALWIYMWGCDSSVRTPLSEVSTTMNELLLLAICRQWAQDMEFIITGYLNDCQNISCLTNGHKTCIMLYVHVACVRVTPLTNLWKSDHFLLFLLLKYSPGSTCVKPCVKLWLNGADATL